VVLKTTVFCAVISVSEKHAAYIFRAFLLWGSFISEDENKPGVKFQKA
jgi:hypothetical protein